MNSFASSTNTHFNPAEENRYQMVNTVAQQAKIILASMPSASTTNHMAIREAMRKSRIQRSENAR